MSWIKDIWNGFKTGASGLSGRKLSAFWAIVVVSTFLSYKNTTEKNAIQMVGMWLIFALICLGLVTIPELIKFITEVKNQPKQE